MNVRLLEGGLSTEALIPGSEARPSDASRNPPKTVDPGEIRPHTTGSIRG
jgi:hypothetical protein